MAYKSPTLIETYAELHLRPGTLSESRFFELVPELKKLGFDDVEFATVGVTVDIKQGRPSPREMQRVRCWKPGRTQLVQVGEDLVVVNLTGPYPGWDAFVGLFGEARRAITQGLGTSELTSLVLGAIDSFEVPKGQFFISEYLRVGGTVIPTWYEDCGESLDLTLGRGVLEVDGRNRQIFVSVRAASDPVRFGFRTQFHDLVQPGSDINALLFRLHDESNATFEALITDHMRYKIMGGRLP